MPRHDGPALFELVPLFGVSIGADSEKMNGFQLNGGLIRPLERSAVESGMCAQWSYRRYQTHRSPILACGREWRHYSVIALRAAVEAGTQGVLGPPIVREVAIVALRPLPRWSRDSSLSSVWTHSFAWFAMSLSLYSNQHSSDVNGNYLSLGRLMFSTRQISLL